MILDVRACVSLSRHHVTNQTDSQNAEPWPATRQKAAQQGSLEERVPFGTNGWDGTCDYGGPHSGYRYFADKRLMACGHP
jgi:hypothetical protein